MAKNNNTLVFNGLIQGMSWDQIKEAKDEIKRHQGEKRPTKKDILTDWIIGKDYMLQQQGNTFDLGGSYSSWLSQYKEANPKDSYSWGELSKGKLEDSFSNGNGLNSALGIAGTALNWITDFADSVNSVDNSAQLDAAKQIAEQQINFGDNTSLMNTQSNLQHADTNIAATDVGGHSFGQSAMNVGKDLLSGAATGLTVGGPWGAVIGGVAGLAKGVVQEIVTNDKASEAARIASLEGKQANGQIGQRVGYVADEQQQLAALTQRQHMTSKGGHLAQEGDKKKNKYAIEGSLADKYKYTTLGALLGPPEMTYTKTPEEYQEILNNEAQASAILQSALAPITMSPVNNWPTFGYITGIGSPFLFKKINDSFTKKDNEVKEIQKRIGIEYSKGGKLNKAHRFAEGGLLNTYDYGLEEVNAGGSHEENPNEGVIVSYAPDGLPNKVEEGETIHNDYVYSKRLEANKKVLQNNLLDKKYEGKSFADISKKLTEDRKKRPNDPISVRTNEENLARLQDAQEELKLDNKTKEVKRFLGSLNNDQLNALQQEMMDEYEAYAEQLAKQQEQEDQTYQEEQAAQEGMFGRGGHIGQLGMRIQTNKPKFYNRFFLEEKPSFDLGDWYKEQVNITPNHTVGKDINIDFYQPYTNDTIKDRNSKKGNNSSLAPLRFAEAFGSAGQYLSDILGLTNQPDYSNARMYQRAIDNIGGVNFTPIGNYLTYTPIDTEYINNQQMATAAARRNYGNVVGNYTLGLLNDYNTFNQIGATAIAARQQNQEQKNKVAEFNRATNDRNSAMSLDAQKQNAALRAQRAQEYRYLADMMTKERDTNEAARAANYQNFMSNLAAIGREDFNYDQIKWMIDHGVFPVGAESYLTGLKI